MSVESETRTAGILQVPYALTTVGTWSLVFLAAFESLAVTTIMPIVTADLDGRGLYALAFSSTLAAGVVGMVAFGSWADRRGPAVPLLASVCIFALGLALAGTATAMPVFVAGRFLQGLGAGGETVALYVLVAAVYPAGLHIKIFGAFASAWVLPSLVGPFAAGLVADALSWHWCSSACSSWSPWRPCSCCRRCAAATGPAPIGCRRRPPMRDGWPRRPWCRSAWWC